MDANPAQVSFHWTFNGSEKILASKQVDESRKGGNQAASLRHQPVVNKNDTISVISQWKASSSAVHQSMESVLHVRPISMDDFGLFACWAKNVAGLQAEPCLFAVLPMSKLSFNAFASCSRLSDENMNLKCLSFVSSHPRVHVYGCL